MQVYVLSLVGVHSRLSWFCRQASLRTDECAGQALQAAPVEEPQGRRSYCPGAQVGQASGDWRAFRAALVAQEAGVAAEESARPAEDRAAQDWVHPIALPERGCLLLARHPDMEPAFADAVVFLLECGARSCWHISCFWFCKLPVHSCRGVAWLLPLSRKS